VLRLAPSMTGATMGQRIAEVVIEALHLRKAMRVSHWQDLVPSDDVAERLCPLCLEVTDHGIQRPTRLT